MNAPLPRTWYDPDRREIDPRAKVIRQLVTAGNLLLTAALESHDQIGNAAEAWNFAVAKLRRLDDYERAVTIAPLFCHVCGLETKPVAAIDAGYPMATPQGLVHQGCMADHRAHY